MPMPKMKHRVIGWAIMQEGHLEWHKTDGYAKPLIFQTKKEARENLRLGSTADVCRVEEMCARWISERVHDALRIERETRQSEIIENCNQP